tara:strand:+ start:839 stop:1465 length:627 start_codon:yes stop_codon:yes gene_type:complete
MTENTIKNYQAIIINFFKKNYKIILSICIFLIIIFAVLQFYLWNKNKNILDLSLKYEEALSIDKSSIEFKEKLLKISKEKNIYGTISSLNLINEILEEKNFEEAYENYLILLKKENDPIYKNIISINASYNLFDYINIDKISNLLSYFDTSLESLNGYYYELLFMISIKDGRKEDAINLAEQILDDDKISSLIKDRVKKINVFEKYNK